MRKIILPFLLLLCSLSVFANDGDTLHVRVQDHRDMTWYGNYDQMGYFPTTGKTYNQVLMNFTLGCASGGCSDWDYDVHIELMKPTGAYDSNISRIDTITFSPLTLDTVWNVYPIEETFEMARVITPYGGYMRTSANGFNNAWEHRHLFDVSDFITLLRDSVKVRSFYSGWSSGFDVTLDFYFIEGTAPRNVISIQNFFQGSAGYPDSTTFNSVNTPAKSLLIPAGTKQAKVRIIPTGHGFDNDVNCAEFCPKNYFIKINGSNVATANIWDDQCGMNPVFPQGGTWVFNRANWCPGKRAKIFEHDITSSISANNTFDFDFDIEGFTWTGSQAPSYSITAQTIAYGDNNFQVDAELSNIIAPSNHEEQKRYNPMCSNPIVEIKNNGKYNLKVVDIKYWAKGADPCWYTWRGDLAFGQTTQVTLPIYDWFHLDTIAPEFYAEVVYPTEDQWVYNNKKTQAFSMPPVYPNRMELWFKTNNLPDENTYVLLNDAGDTLKKFTGTVANTTYRDTFDLAPGCYSFQVTDKYGDGMNDWPLSQGNGLIQLRRFSGTTTIPYITLERDFGTKNTRNFMVGYPLGYGTDMPACQAIDHTSIENLKPLDEQIKVYPNPAVDILNMDINLQQASKLEVKIFNELGVVQLARTYDQISNGSVSMDVSKLAKGIYFVQLKTNEQQMSQKIIISK
ncbi:MAG: peptide-N-glycosidase F-related protein [Bacteroidota bacterium]